MSSSEPSTPEPLSPTAPISDRSWGIIFLWIVLVLTPPLVIVGMWLTRGPTVSNDTAPRLGKPLADFTLLDLQGRSVQLTALRGKVVFVNVWATYCQPCIDEMPTIQQLYERLHGGGLEI